MIHHGWYVGQLIPTIQFYQNMQYQVKLMHQTKENDQKPRFWLFESFKKAFCNIRMIQHWWYDVQLMHNIYFCQNMQYQVNLIHQTQEIDQNLIFRFLDHSKRHFVIYEWSSTSVTIGQSCTLFISMIIHTFKSIRLSEFKKMAKRNLLATWTIQKGILWFLNAQTLVILWPKHENHLVLLKYAILSQSDAPNSKKWPKTSFLALWIIQKGIFVIFEWSSMEDMTTHVSRSFSIIKICNLKSIRCTKLKKMAENHNFGLLDHS